MATPVMLQCKDSSTIEKALDVLGSGWITHDNRVYSHIRFGDDEVYYDIDAQTLRRLYDLQSWIEMSVDSGQEMGFLEVVKRAQELQLAFKQALEAIKFQPILRKPRGHG